ncbi:unnamed protein product [Owenia fusiformis]|uniref:Uncharacterized protein n=1 Tax=Owenia fusiformis TaxID=6347 RepID=A0A8S4PLB4_OWEFU|nr:unnamed protein product [Owenia fusiformis]
MKMEKKDKMCLTSIVMVFTMVITVVSLACSVTFYYELLQEKEELLKVQVAVLRGEDEIQELKTRIEALEKQQSSSSDQSGRMADGVAHSQRGKRQAAGTSASGCIYGRDGRDGMVGPQGPPGQQGPPGPAGRDGRDGLTGQGLSTEDISNLVEAFHTNYCINRSTGAQGTQVSPAPIGSSPPGTGGATYVRWGRTTCPTNVEQVYSGIAGKSHHIDKGGGVNYLCLPRDPEWGKTMAGWQTASFANIQGVEFELGSNNPFLTDNYPDPSQPASWLHNHDVVCTVCRVPERGSQIMIPAHKSCPDTWTLEYNGYLMSEGYKNSKSDYICLDEAPEADEGGHEDKNGALLLVVEADCGHTLPCPNYQHGFEVTCAVCTK